MIIQREIELGSIYEDNSFWCRPCGAIRQGKFSMQLTRKTLPGPTKILSRSKATKLIKAFFELPWQSNNHNIIYNMI